MVHEKKKPFMCDLCGSSNSTRQRLKRHIETVHKGIKKHQCSICEARFSSTYNMRLHIASAHEKKKLYQCSLCSDSFARKENLMSHITSVHPLQPTSPDRSETFFHTPFHKWPPYYYIITFIGAKFEESLNKYTSIEVSIELDQ